jgi:broad specificity phosphatase PhoE
MLVLVRHGESEANAATAAGSEVDGPTNTVRLTALGERQARATARALATIRKPRVVASPFTRACMTARAFATVFDVDDDLREFERDGEEWFEFVKRCRCALTRLLAHDGCTVAFTHSLFIATALELFVRGFGPMGPDACMFQTPNCAITVLEKLPGLPRAEWRLVSHASIGHLPHAQVSGAHGAGRLLARMDSNR